MEVAAEAEAVEEEELADISLSQSTTISQSSNMSQSRNNLAASLFRRLGDDTETAGVLVFAGHSSAEADEPSLRRAYEDEAAASEVRHRGCSPC